MPNWCENKLTVAGEQKNIEAFFDASTGLPADYPLTEFEKKLYPDYERPTEKRFCFNALVPVPGEVLEIGFDGHGVLGADDERIDGYNWQIRNWGTKWDIYNDAAEPEFMNGEAVLYFDTAWAPPEGWLETVAPMFPDLFFCLEYNEPGMCFAGRVEYTDGKNTYAEYISGKEYLALYADEEDGN